VRLTGVHGEDALVGSPQGLAAYVAPERLDSEREFSERKRSPYREGSGSFLRRKGFEHPSGSRIEPLQPLFMIAAIYLVPASETATEPEGNGDRSAVSQLPR